MDTGQFLFLCLQGPWEQRRQYSAADCKAECPTALTCLLSLKSSHGLLTAALGVSSPPPAPQATSSDPRSPAAPGDAGSVRIYHLLTDKAQSLREDVIIYLGPLKGVQK